MRRLKLSPLMLALAGAGILFISTPSALARAPQQNKTSSQKPNKKNVRELSKVTVIAKELSLTRIPLDAQFTESVIGPSAIRFTSPMMSVQSLLERTPSINVRTPAANGMRSNVTFRAFSSGQFSETFDGVPLNDPFNGGATNSASTRNNVPLTLANIDSVHLYRGINNPAVTSYNSLGGTIAYQPRMPSDTANASVTFGGGSFRTWLYGLTANTGSIGGVRSLVSLNHNTSKGWQKNSGNSNLNFYYAGVLPYAHDEGRVYAYAIYNRNMGYTPHTVPLPLIQQYGYGYGWPLDWTQSYNKDHGGTYIIGNSMNVNDTFSYNIRVYSRNVNYNRLSYSNPAYRQSATQPYYLPNQAGDYSFWLYNPVGPTYDPAATFGSNVLGNSYHTYIYATQQTGIMPHFTLYLGNNTVKFGGDYSHTSLHSAEYWYGAYPMPLKTGYNNAWDEHDSRNLGSFFAQDEISLLNDKLSITPGVKYIFARTSDRDAIGFFYDSAGTISDSEHYTSPTIGLNYKASDTVSLYASWGKTAKFPDIAAYYYSVGYTTSSGAPLVIPLHVTPEYVNDIEAGVRYEDQGFEGALNYYRENFQNTFIDTTDPSTGLTTTSNGGSSRYQGVELDLQDSIDTSYGGFSVYGNIAENKANFTSDFTVASTSGALTLAGNSVTSGQPLAGVPKHLANLGVGWKFEGWRAKLGAHYSGSQYVNEYNAGLPSAEQIPSYTVVNFTLRDTISLGDWMVKDVKLALYVDNLLNRHYYTFGYGDTTWSGTPFVRAIYEEPRAYFGSATFDF